MIGLDPVELSWAAGFFDGEGSTTSNPKYRRLLVRVSQVRREPLDRFHRAIGGIGKITGPHKGHSPRASDFYQWSGTSYAASQHVIAVLWKYLSEPKKEQAVEAFKRANRPMLPRGPARAKQCHCGHLMADTRYVRPDGLGTMCMACDKIRKSLARRTSNSSYTYEPRENDWP